MSEKDKILAVYQTMQQAMIDKDIDALDRIVKEGTIFTHMSGKKQTKAEYFGEIADGTLNYYRYQIKNCEITVNSDNAILTADVTLTAKVYGMSGSWTLPVNAHFEKIHNDWLYTN
jgi:ketosteroid isomerase-like protein